jgi:3-dehydroquinate synthase
VGKTSVGRELADRLGRRFVDVDRLIEKRYGAPIPQIFKEKGEAQFRRLEKHICQELACGAGQVISLGGGALMDESMRALMESTGTVICLRAGEEALWQRVPADSQRPLLAEGGRAGHLELLRSRQGTYDGFEVEVETDGLPLTEVIDRVSRRVEEIERRRLPVRQGPGYTIHFQRGLLHEARDLLGRDHLEGPIVVVGDHGAISPWAEDLAQALDAPLEVMPAGEQAKRLDVVQDLFAGFLEHSLDRQAVVIAVGGGACLDTAGFAAATFMRGVRWIAVPTSLLAMVDASVGGKVAVNLPQGKNLVGAFHPPAAVWADPRTLKTLPSVEWRNGMAELIKAALIADPHLFGWIENGCEGPTEGWILRALQVKVNLVEIDPEDRGARAQLNVGHTVAHALEASSGYAMAHGQAVALGLVAEAQMAAAMGLANSDLPLRIQRALQRWQLPTRAPDLDSEVVMAAMQSDKKSREREPLFALPLTVGGVEHNLRVPPHLLRTTLERMGEAE